MVSMNYTEWFLLSIGPSEDAENFQHEQRGVIPRSFEYLYNLIARERELVSVIVL